MPANPQDIDLMARTMVAENRSGSPDEYAAIAHVMRSRLLSGNASFGDGRAPTSMLDVLMAPTKPGGAYKQFTPWGLDVRDQNGGRTTNNPLNVDLRSPAYQSAYHIASDVMSGNSQDPTNGAVNYHATSMKTPPSWAKGRVGQQIGQHTFYGPTKTDDVDYSHLIRKPQPSQVAGEDAAPSGDNADYSHLITGKPAPPPEPPQPTTVAESVAQSRQQGRGIPATFQDAMQTLIRQHPVAAGIFGGTAAAATGIPLAGAAAVGMNALPGWGQVATGYGAYKLGEMAGVPQAVGNLWDIIRSSVPH